MMQRNFSQLTDQSFDAVICGGGIYGAWSAYDAALRGLKVALVDQGDWACATSSASSKLIHGGLRYLELLDFKLVRKTLQERQLLLAAGPHKIWPLRFGIPVYQDSRLGSLRLKSGLIIYDLLAGVLNSNQAHQHFSRAEFSNRFPCLNTDFLTGGFSYLDAQTDDARLVLELVDGALSAGAVCLNYCQVTDVIEQQGKISSVRIRDLVTAEETRVHTRHLVKTTGQWLAATEACRLSKGVHLVMPKLLENEALLLTAKSDGRVFFIIPWYGLTLLGTTDTDYAGDVDQVSVDPQDVEYLLTEANRKLKSIQWTKHDIIGCFAGLRVLKQRTKTAPSEVSRDWELKISGNGLLTSIGGKITSARADAAYLIDKLCEQLNIHESCKTRANPLPWAPATDYIQWTADNSREARQLGVDEECALWLLRRYGKCVDPILKAIAQNPRLAERIIPATPFIRAELAYCARNEMVIHLDDLLRRRIPLLILAKLSPNDLRQLAENAAAVLNWDTPTLNNEIDRCIQKWPIQ